MTVTIGSCFAGIGGLELGIGLGLQRFGIAHRVDWQCEIDEYAQAVLRRHWPDAKRYQDITRMKGAENVDIVCGGFPCQDISAAGKGAGLDGARSGLFFDLLRVACDVGCRVLVLENVAAITTRGGLRVIGALAECGFDAAFAIVSASDVGAPHKRARWFCVAWKPLPNAERQRVHGEYVAGTGRQAIEPVGHGEVGRVANTNGQGQPQQGGAVEPVGRWSGNSGGELADPASIGRAPQGEPRAGVRQAGDADAQHQGAPQPRVGRVPDGLSAGLDRRGFRWPAGRGEYQADWEPSRVVAPRSVWNRGRRIKALGNAVVPQQMQLVAEHFVVPALYRSGVLS